MFGLTTSRYKSRALSEVREYLTQKLRVGSAITIMETGGLDDDPHGSPPVLFTVEFNAFNAGERKLDLPIALLTHDGVLRFLLESPYETMDLTKGKTEGPAVF